MLEVSHSFKLNLPVSYGNKMVKEWSFDIFNLFDFSVCYASIKASPPTYLAVLTILWIFIMCCVSCSLSFCLLNPFHKSESL